MLDQLINLQTFLVFVLAYCIIVAYMKARRPQNFPPGPPTYPFTGNCSVVAGNQAMHKTFSKLAKQYGPIFGLQLGWYPLVVISNYELLKEALVDKGEDFSNRGTHFLLTKLLGTEIGIINNHGEVWKGTRRMAIRSLREFGFGKSSMEEHITDEAEALTTEIGKQQGKPFRFNLLFNKAASNIVNLMLFGERYGYENEELVNMLDKLNIVMKTNGLQVGAVVFVPYLLPFLFLDRHIFRNLQIFNNLGKFVKKKIKEHRQKFDPDNIGDFVDVYLEMEMKDSKNKMCVERNLFQSIVDLFMAGAETTSTTLLWAMLFMLNYPDVQEKCREEIIKVVGKERKPCLKDRDSLPYVDATICEVQRLGNIVPHSVMHCTSREVEFHGYTLPKNCMVIPNLYDIHMDPDTWKDPEIFNPERFLNDDGKVVRPPQFQPFSLGKRSCLGESLARSELFLFFTTMLQHYKFTCEDVNKLPDLTSANMGVTLSPEPYDIIATPV